MEDQLVLLPVPLSNPVPVPSSPLQSLCSIPSSISLHGIGVIPVPAVISIPLISHPDCIVLGKTPRGSFGWPRKLDWKFEKFPSMLKRLFALVSRLLEMLGVGSVEALPRVEGDGWLVEL